MKFWQDLYLHTTYILRIFNVHGVFEAQGALWQDTVKILVVMCLNR